MKKLVTLSLILVSSVTVAQQIPLDSWRSHFSYSSARLIAQANNTLFCVSENGLFTVDMENLETRRLGKENGLGDVAASAIHFSASTNQLIIGYGSGLIDLIDQEGNITTLTTFRDAPIVGNKQINDIKSNGSNAYLATPIGIVRVNLTSKTVIENYRNVGQGGQPIDARELSVKGDSLVVVTAGGIQIGNFNDNLLDFNDWRYFNETNAGGFSEILAAADKLYVLRNGTDLWIFNGTAWQSTGTSFPVSINHLYFANKLYALSDNAVYEIDPSPVIVLTDPLLTSGNQLLISNGIYWIADADNGLLSIGTTTKQIIPNGPLNDHPTKLSIINGSVYSLYGPKPTNYSGGTDGLGYSRFSGGQWATIDIPGFYNITDVGAINDRLYFTSMGFGLYDASSNTLLNSGNSILKNGNSFNGVQLAAIAQFNENLWALSYNAPDALYKINSDETIESFSPAETGFSRTTDLSITQEGLIWAIKASSEGGGIGIFDPAINQTRTLRTNDGLPSSTVTGLAIDSNDEAWIGTSLGIANYASASFPFNSFGVSIPIFQNGFLFEDQPIRSILTDGGDRLWVGTDEGIWILSKDLTEVVSRFTSENSPLPDSHVVQMAYEGISGEVFIVTEKGMVSYRSASSAAASTHQSKISVFPNPVRLGIDNIVGINGLARNANVRITDTMGRLVKELNAAGGTASWNLDSFNSSKIAPGIYLVFSSTADGTDTMVGKIAVIR